MEGDITGTDAAQRLREITFRRLEDLKRAEYRCDGQQGNLRSIGTKLADWIEFQVE